MLLLPAIPTATVLSGLLPGFMKRILCIMVWLHTEDGESASIIAGYRILKESTTSKTIPMATFKDERLYAITAHFSGEPGIVIKT